MLRISIIFYITLIFLVSCSNSQTSEKNHSQESIPVATPALHFWQNVDFSKIDFQNTDENQEKMFLEYLQFLSHTNPDIVKESIKNLLSNAQSTNKSAYIYYVKLFEKYLYNPNSSFRNENIYLVVLNHISDNNDFEEVQKAQYEFQLKMISKNQVGDIASDFQFINKNGSTDYLSEIETEYLILYFNNPDCPDCKRVKEILSTINNPNVKILSIYPDKDLSVWLYADFPSSWINGYNYSTIHVLYDLKAIPTLYLLDNEKRVILKDTDIESLLNAVSKISSKN